MGKEIDTKVIQLEFENGEFEKGAQQSLKTIDKLDTSIQKLSDSANGGESIDKVQKVVVDKMSVISSVVNTTVSRITNDVLNSINKVTHAFDSLTIAPVSQGFSKYESQIESVQTIMNATGKSIEDVQKQLDKLMWYTDETSYSYSDMAANIGKFTSAGVELDDAVTAMMGIANWAGVSGANVQQASRAMYNLSQAMGTGSLKLQDWMSIENANMATKEFKQTLIDTAKEIGVLEQDTEITAENMRETLKDGWVTSEVLTKTLAKYGNYTEDLYKIVEEGIDGVDGATAAMEEYSSRYSDIMDGLYEVYKEYGKESEEFKKKVQENSITIQTALDLVAISEAREYNQGLNEIREALIKVADTYGYESEQFRAEAEKNGFTLKEAAKMVKEGVDSFKMAEVSLGEKSLRAAQEAKTFKDAWDATIDGVSSKWLAFWQALFGNYEEAKQLWTWLANNPLYDAFVTPIEQITEAMQKAHDMGSFDQIFEGFQAIWNGPENAEGERNGGILRTFEELAKAFTEIFDFFQNNDQLSFYIYALTVRFREWAESLTLSDEKLLKLRETAENVFTMLKAVGEIVFNLGWNIGRIIQAILPSKETILAVIGDIFGETAKVEEQVGNITETVTFATNVIVFCIKLIKTVAMNAIKNLPIILGTVIAIIYNAIDTVIHSDIFKTVTTVVTTVGAALIGVVAFIVSQLSFLLAAIIRIIVAIIGVIEQFKNSEDKIQWLKEQFGEILKIFEPVKIIFESVIKAFTVVSSVIGHLLGGIADFISKIDVWRAALILLVLTLASNGVGIIAFLGSVLSGITSFIGNFITTLNPIKFILNNFLTGIKDAVDSLINIIDVAKIRAIGFLILSYAGSVVLLATAAIMLSTIDVSAFKAALFGTLALMGVLFAFALGVNKLMSQKSITDIKQVFDNSGKLQETITTITQTLKLGAGLFGIGFAVKAMASLASALGEVYAALGSPTAFWTVLSGVAILLVGVITGIAIMVKIIKDSAQSKIDIKSDVQNLDGFVLNIDLLGGTLNKLALALIGIGLALAIMDFVDPDRLMSSATVLLGAALALTIISSTIGIMTKKLLLEKDADEENKALAKVIEGLGKVITGIAGAVFKISLALALMSLVDEEKLRSATYSLGVISIALIGLIVVFTMLVRSINEEYTKDLSGQIGKFNGNFGVNGYAGAYKNGVGGNDIIKAALGIQMLSLAFIGIAASLIPLTLVDTTAMIEAAVTITGVMFVMSLIMAAFTTYLDKADKVESMDLIKIATSLGIMAVGINLIGAALLPLAAGIALSSWLFKENDIHPIGRAVGAIAEIIAAFTGYAVVLISALALYTKKVDVFIYDDTFGAVARSLVTMAAGVDLIAVAIAALMGMQMLAINKNAHSLRDSVAAITTIMTAMTGMVVGLMLSLSTVAKTGNTDVDKIVKQTGVLLVLMSAAVSVVTACISALSLISIIPNAKVGMATAAIATIMTIMSAFSDIAIYMTSKGNTYSSSIISSLGSAFVAMSAGLAIISAGIALIAYTIGKYNVDYKGVTAAMAGLAVVFAEIGAYLIILASKSKDYSNLTGDLLMIAAATGVMAASIAVIAVALGSVLQYGENAFAGIGIFFTLVVIIGVYNAVMLALADAYKDGATTQLLLIAADFLVMAAAIAMIAPAVAQMAELQKQLGDGSIALAVIEGVILPMAAMIGAVWVLIKMANGSGQNTGTKGLVSVAVMMVSLAAAMGILAYAANILAGIDTAKISQVSASIVTTMVAFTICVGLLSYISDKTNDSIPKLAISFLIFAASIWLVSEALDSMHNALANIINDPNVQNFSTILAEFITEHPVAAAATALGVSVGANILLGIKDELDKQGINLLLSPVSAITEGLTNIIKNKLFDPTTGLMPMLGARLSSSIISVTSAFAGTAIGARLFAGSGITSALSSGTATLTESVTALGFTLVGTLMSAIAAGLLIYDAYTLFTPEDDNIFVGWGAHIGEKMREGVELTLGEKIVSEFFLKPFGDFFVAASGYTEQTRNALTVKTETGLDNIQSKMSAWMNYMEYREHRLVTYEEMLTEMEAYYGQDWGYKDDNITRATEEELRKSYQNVYDAYYDLYIQPKEEHDKKLAAQEEQLRKDRISAAEKEIENYMKQVLDSDGKILTYEQLINEYRLMGFDITPSKELKTAYEEAYNAVVVTAETSVKKKTLIEKAGSDEITKQIEARNQAEAKAAEMRGRAASQYYDKQEQRATNLMLLNEDADDKKQDALDEQEETTDAIDNILSDMMTKEGARNAELAQQNKLLTEQSGILSLNNSLQSGGLANVISQITTSTDVVGAISKYIGEWKDSKIQKLSNLFGGTGNVNQSTLGRVFTLISGGKGFNEVLTGIKSTLGISSNETAKSIFDELGGGLIDLSKLAEFDINDITGSLNKIFKGDAANLFQEIFGLSAADFSVDKFLEKIKGDLNLDDIVQQMANSFGESGNYEQIDYSKVVDTFGEDWSNIGSSSADAFTTSLSNGITTGTATKVKTPMEELAETMTGIVDHVQDVAQEAIEREAEAAEKAYTTAFNAAKEAHDKIFAEDDSLLGKSKQSVYDQAISINDHILNAKAYKKNLDYYNGLVKGMAAKILDENGEYKAGVKQADKTAYEKTVEERDRYQQLYDSELQTIKTAKDDLAKEKARQTYLKDPSTLQNAIDAQQAIVDSMHLHLANGDFPNGQDIVEIYRQEVEKLNELLGIQEEINKEEADKLAAMEGEELNGQFDFNSPEAKAAYSALTKRNNEIVKRVKELDIEIGNLSGFRDDETKAYVSSLRKEREELLAERDKNTELKDNMSAYWKLTMDIEEIEKRIENNKKLLQSKSFKSQGYGNLYLENQQLEEQLKEKKDLQARILSLSAEGVESGKVESENITETQANTNATIANTTALNDVTAALKNAYDTTDTNTADEVAKQGYEALSNIPEDTDKWKTEDSNYRSVEEIKAEQEKQLEDNKAELEKQKEEIKTTASINNRRDMMTALGGMVSSKTTTVGDISAITADVSAIRAASESINTNVVELNDKVNTLQETISLMYINAQAELAVLTGWRGETGAAHSNIRMSLANIQNKGVPIANRSQFVKNISEEVDSTLGTKAAMRART